MAAEKIDQPIGLVQIDREGVDGEITCGEIALDGIIAQPREIDHLIATDDTCSIMLCIEDVHIGQQAIGRGPRGSNCITLDGDVPIMDWQAQQQITHCPADEPRLYATLGADLPCRAQINVVWNCLHNRLPSSDRVTG